ncbi:MAG: hypothetical protein MUF78_07495 [Candidatus Edwardsbacteria bacterium]|jgi:predicted RNA-binding Zn-ribbon protein involved in translation (DUF1610 family)|nr:hypothetical protein [Candidatus Edwardsbacteria bacterium]
MTKDQKPYTLSCQACGGKLNPKPGQATVRCAHCGNTVAIPAEARGRKPFTPPEEPLEVRLGKLVGGRHDGAAVQLLRDELSLPPAAAGELVELVRLNECKDVARIIKGWMEGRAQRKAIL